MGIPRTRTTLLFVGFFLLAASRRWQQFTCPQVWCEDGEVMAGFARLGWREFLVPVNGYLILAPKLLTGAVLALSLPWYPLLSTVLATAFSALVGVAVSTAPTNLRLRTLCALGLFLVPSNPEVFDLPLYALWWAPVLLLLVALWDEDDPRLGLRLLFLVLGGLSSPFIVVVVPALAIRALARPRAPVGWALAGVGAAAAVVQAGFLLRGTGAVAPTGAALGRFVVPKFCGWYVAGNFSPDPRLLWALGLGILALLAAQLPAGGRRPASWILTYLWAGSIAASVLRVDPAVLHPAAAGPRYFFLPFVTTTWLLLQQVARPGPRGLRLAAALAAGAAVANAVPVWSRRHVDLEWRAQVRSARCFPSYGMLIESDGLREHAWGLALPQEQWLKLWRRALDRGATDPAGAPTFAYRVLLPSDRPAGAALPAAGARVDFAAGTAGPAGLRLSPRGRIEFRSGADPVPIPLAVVGSAGTFIGRLPVYPDWVTLEFSNAKLQPGCAFRVGAPGRSVGEWRPAP